jgi:hypothetical protein
VGRIDWFVFLLSVLANTRRGRGREERSGEKRNEREHYKEGRGEVKFGHTGS